MADLIAELERVVRLYRVASDMAPGGKSRRAIQEADAAAADFITGHHAEIAAAVRDKRRMDWLEGQREAYGFENEHHGNRWVIDGPFRDARQAIDTAMRAGEGEG